MVFVPRNNDNMGEVGGAPNLTDAFYALPIITRYWFGATVVLTLTVNFGVMDGNLIYWDFDFIKTKLELWRIISSFCYAGPFSLHMLITLYMIYNFSKGYEQSIPFNTGAGGGTADYAFCMMLGGLAILATFPLLKAWRVKLMPLFCENLLSYVIYIWSKKHPSNQVSIWGFPVQGMYFPFVLLALNVLTGAPYNQMLHGYALGHLYYFAVDIVPTVYGKDFLHTPVFLINQFGYNDFQPEPARPAQTGRGRNNFNNGNSTNFTSSGGSGGGGGSNNNRGSGGHNWGSGGSRLGTN